jgi:signal transduction histidine kinase
MPEQFGQKKGESLPLPRIFLWTLLGVFNAFLWLLLLAFHWEITLRAREIHYFGTQLFPLHTQWVPIPVIYAVCALLTIASAGAILRDRNSLAQRERTRTLLYQILDSLEIGVVVLDGKCRLTMSNSSARGLLPEIPPDNPSLDILEILKARPELRRMVEATIHHKTYVKEVGHELGAAGDSRPARITTLPLKDSQKRTTGTVLLVHDIREVAAMERQMRNAERLSSLGTLAATMAHEIRNPLEALDLNLALLDTSLAAIKPAGQNAQKITKYVKILEEEISRLAAIVDNFLSFARPSNSPMEEIRLDVLMRQIVDLLTNQAQSRKVTLELHTQGNPNVLGSEDQLKQAFLNLVINSLEAMPQGGLLRIRAEAIYSRQNMAVVHIEDTGVGIPPDQIPKLFDPFFSTRPKGTGLGLTIVYRIIQEHHGHIRVTSAPGEGSTFTVELPLFAPEGRRETAAHV